MDLVMARIVGGMAFGAALVLAPVYIAEIAPPDKRGRLVSIQQLNIVLGFSVSYFSNYWLQGSLSSGAEWLTETNVWRYMFGMECVPAVIYFFALFFIPRSPRWLFTQGKKEEALRIMEGLKGKEAAAAEAVEIEASIAASKKQPKARLNSLFDIKLRYILLVALILGVIQQITGINAIFFYATTIFEQSGIGTNAAFAQAVWIGIINVVFTLIAMALIDKMGRKPLLLIGLAGIVLSMGLTSYGFKQATYTLSKNAVDKLENIDKTQLGSLTGQTFDNDVAFKNALKKNLGAQLYAKHEGDLVKAAIKMNPILILIGLLGFVASFAISLGPVMWVMLSEMFPNYIRGLAISAIGFINSLTSWLVQFIFPWELANLGNAITYLIYAVFAVIGFLLILKFCPETKGKSLEELEQSLVGK